jgi:hypothetical protein
MSFTDTEKHWLWGCAAATAASRSDVNVAMPHLRGKWSPTNAILRILESSSMRQSLHSSCPAVIRSPTTATSGPCHPRPALLVRPLSKNGSSTDGASRGMQKREGFHASLICYHARLVTVKNVSAGVSERQALSNLIRCSSSRDPIIKYDSLPTLMSRRCRRQPCRLIALPRCPALSHHQWLGAVGKPS